MTRALWKPWHGLEALYLGEIIVGRVSINRNGKGDAASWIFNLAGATAHWTTARTVEQAREAVEAKLHDWLDKAGFA
ncbi:hypothetical protein B0I00_1862 [Novosphingobium kunmingense]|uniref:Uncharacterized protein n=1 Tax=Novosphingobium kunmingense TaxID=1211806 RepID=A0A2N0HKX8_9SPHN|nr:hypothetical protein [Novosphingobium kunmingense]PKB19623.1 hypothetical protein B0I00_1862 [Novosphingobium kunmingense]